MEVGWTALGETVIPSTCEYCYLGVTFSITGALKVAQRSEKLFLPEKDVRHERTQESGSVQTI